ncbi:hypothetical protein ACLVWU_13500 [Bdellovibrio sp. HCB290]|uniref:hypothetical protein n=1 Tax=Bdellovibrio sp. HCB290 TaxID=3394356 RepID=UPI0039B6063A
MAYKPSFSLLSLVMVTAFVSYSMAEQQVIATQNKRYTVGTQTQSSGKSTLADETKFLPKILDNSKIDLNKSENEPQGEFQVNRVFGPGSGGGGNICASGIVKLTKKILNFGLYRANLQGDQEEKLKRAIFRARFSEGQDLYVRGEKKNAINYPNQSLIVMDKRGCELVHEGHISGIALLMHEYLGLAGIDDRDYSTSYQFADALYNNAPVRNGSIPLGTEAIRNVAICAATCGNEVLGIDGHERAIVGKIYYALATAENLVNPKVCLAKARNVLVVSDRHSSQAFESCLNALTGKYTGKAVDIFIGGKDFEVDNGSLVILPTNKSK